MVFCPNYNLIVIWAKYHIYKVLRRMPEAHCVQRRVGSLSLEQLVVRTLLDDLPGLQHDDVIGSFDG